MLLPNASRGDTAASDHAKTVKPVLGIALSGGAARGWAHIGVLRALEEAGYVPDIIAGTSIGAVVGGCYAAGKLDTLEDFARGINRRRLFRLMDFDLRGSGLITGNKLAELLDREVADTQIGDLSPRVVCVATELGTGHEVWLQRGPLVDALRASYALPGIFRPVRISGRWLIDGALVNPIPVSVCRALGARLVVAVNLNADDFGRGTIVPHHMIEETVPEPDERGEDTADTPKVRRREATAPGISSVVIDAFNITQDRIARSRLAGDPPDIMMSLRLRRIGLFEFHRAEEAIKIGYEAAQRSIPDIADSIVALGQS